MENPQENMYMGAVKPRFFKASRHNLLAYIGEIVYNEFELYVRQKSDCGPSKRQIAARKLMAHNLIEIYGKPGASRRRKAIGAL